MFLCCCFVLSHRHIVSPLWWLCLRALSGLSAAPWSLPFPMSTGKRARERDETNLGEPRPPKKRRTGGISWEDAFPTKFRSVLSLSEVTSSQTKTLDSGHMGPLFVVKTDHFTSPDRTRLTLSEYLGGKPWLECDIHHNIARVDDPKIGDHVRVSLSRACLSFRPRPGFHDCHVDILGDYFLFIDSSKGGPTRLLTNTTRMLSSNLSSSLFITAAHRLIPFDSRVR